MYIINRSTFCNHKVYYFLQNDLYHVSQERGSFLLQTSFCRAFSVIYFREKGLVLL